jgi:hypothetical protein
MIDDKPGDNLPNRLHVHRYDVFGEVQDLGRDEEGAEDTDYVVFAVLDPLSDDEGCRVKNFAHLARFVGLHGVSAGGKKKEKENEGKGFHMCWSAKSKSQFQFRKKKKPQRKDNLASHKAFPQLQKKNIKFK